MRRFALGDNVLLPDGRVGMVVWYCQDGRVAVETPWSAQWERYEDVSLRPVEEGS